MQLLYIMNNHLDIHRASSDTIYIIDVIYYLDIWLDNELYTTDTRVIPRVNQFSKQKTGARVMT